MGARTARLVGGSRGRSLKAGAVCLALLALVHVTSSDARAERASSALPPLVADAAHPGLWHGGPLGGAKAAVETLYVYGGPGTVEGKFQTDLSLYGGFPDTQGWTGVDLTVKTVVRWNVSTYLGDVLGAAGNHVMWCGDVFDSCTPDDPPEGYGNDWDEWLDWYGTAVNDDQPTSVTVQAVLTHDSEPDYDYLYLQVERSTGMDNILIFTDAAVDTNGNHVPVTVNKTFTVNDVDYVGPSFDQVHLRWRGFADGGYSDEDCLWPSGGLAVIDNVRVSFGGVEQTFDDFEPGHPTHWSVAFPPSVGDFSKVWPRLRDIDPCHENMTPQWAFIDDGVVVPGTGGTPGVSWTYGPGGYVVNITGGLADPTHHLMNEVWSPPIAWPLGEYGGALYEFNIYRHMPLINGLFFLWHVRASIDGGITWGPWRDRGIQYFSNAGDYLRMHHDVTDLLPPGRTEVQLAFGCHEYGWVWGYDASDSTPAPYFDNVAFKVWDLGGPAIAASEIDLFQDNLPANGTLDLNNPASNSVRLDMARNISPKAHLRNDPGDSIVAAVTAARTGSTLLGQPQLHYRLRRNPVFDPYRTSNWPDTGLVLADSARAQPGGPAVPNRWAWDLPDTGFLFPGDELHYCLLAHDQRGGDVGVTALPADLSAFELFPGDDGYDPLRWPGVFTVRALPSVRDLATGEQASVLFWHDAAGCGNDEEWYGALRALGLRLGVDCDVYETNGPTSGVGNGLGGRATAAQLAGYRTLLYTSGDLGSFTLSNGDYNNDASDDVGVLDAWLRQGGKSWLCAGDDLEDNLRLSGAAAVAFRNTWLGVTHNYANLRPRVNNQANPRIKSVQGNAVGLNLEYVAYGGCDVFNDFDAVTAGGTSVRIAEFTSPTGATGVYPYAAAVLNTVVPEAELPASRVVYLPYDLSFIYDRPDTGGAAAKDLAQLPARARLLQQVLAFFGEVPGGTPTAVPPSAGGLTVRAFPNPFNPRVTIALSLPAPGRATVRLYNVRGEQVRALLDDHLPGGRQDLTWDGTDDAKRPVASGVYFVSVQANGQAQMSKVMLVR